MSKTAIHSTQFEANRKTVFAICIPSLFYTLSVEHSKILGFLGLSEVSKTSQLIPLLLLSACVFTTLHLILVFFNDQYSALEANLQNAQSISPPNELFENIQKYLDALNNNQDQMINLHRILSSLDLAEIKGPIPHLQRNYLDPVPFWDNTDYEKFKQSIRSAMTPSEPILKTIDDILTDSFQQKLGRLSSEPEPTAPWAKVYKASNAIAVANYNHVSDIDTDLILSSLKRMRQQFKWRRRSLIAEGYIFQLLAPVLVGLTAMLHLLGSLGFYLFPKITELV